MNDKDKIHDAFMFAGGGGKLNQLCKTDPDLMEARGVSTNFIDSTGYDRLTAEYLKWFPDRKETLGFLCVGRPLEPGKIPIGFTKLFEMERPKLTATDVNELVARKYLVQIQQLNPKTRTALVWKRYEIYKKAKTVAEMLKFGASKPDIMGDVKAGFVKLVKPP